MLSEHNNAVCLPGPATRVGERGDYGTQLMDAGGDGDAGRAKGVDIAALVHRYGRSFVHSSPDVALEYYMQVTHCQATAACHSLGPITPARLVISKSSVTLPDYARREREAHISTMSGPQV